MHNTFFKKERKRRCDFYKNVFKSEHKYKKHDFLSKTEIELMHFTKCSNGFVIKHI